MYKHLNRLMAFATALCIGFGLCACGAEPEAAPLDIAAPEQTNTPGAESPAAPVEIGEIRLPEAGGSVVYEGNGVRLDASNSAQGYVMVCCGADTAKHKLRVSKGDMAYTYDLTPGADYMAFPLQQGDGEYQVRVLRHAYEDLYEPIFEQTVSVSLESEFAPFLLPSQYVYYTRESEAVRQSFALSGGHAQEGDKAEAIYRFVADTIEYDYDKAAAVEGGSITSYLPDADRTLAERKGICFDYAALLSTMLRVQGIPTQMVIGQVQPEGILHAWNLAYVGGNWRLMDATFDDTEHEESDYTAQRIY